MKDLEALLGDLVAQSQLDVDAELLEPSESTRRIYDEIIERYGKVDSEQGK